MAKNKVNILFVGHSKVWDVGYPFKKAFETFGCSLVFIDPADYYSVGIINRILNKFLKLLGRLDKRLGDRVYFGVGKLNNLILKKTTSASFDFVIFDNLIWIKPETLVALRRAGLRIFAWHNHDINDRNNTSRYFYRDIPLCDCHFTTKSYQFQDFWRYGARRVIFTPFAADAELYYPEVVSSEDRKKFGADIVFIGSFYERYRGDILEKLCQRGYDIKVYGNRWERYRGRCLRQRGCLMFRPAEGEEYRKVMNSSKIALALLGKIIPEQHTHRTFEIPACGAFMLHERTKEVADFFEEGREAEFFGSFEELVKKIDYYLLHNEERISVAAAGHQRAVSSDHSYVARARQILDIFEKLSASS